MGFFSPSHMTSKRPLPLLPQCGKCGLKDGCKSPKMPVYGSGKKGIFIVGEAPGEKEDLHGIPFVGKTGQRLRSTLRKFGVDLKEDCWSTNALICHPTSNKVPKQMMIDYCRPNIVHSLQTLNPSTIILLGGAAVRSVIGWLWKEEPGAISQWVGWQIPLQRPNAWVCPTYHPSYIERLESEVTDRIFEEHIEKAVDRTTRPWQIVPDYRKEVVHYLNSHDASRAILGFIEGRRAVAFDYETDRLKPDHHDSRIVCCSISDGKTTIAFPWYGDVIPAMKEFLLSPLPKIASNLKFEERWTIRHLGINVRNWSEDTMLAAHVLDNRENINSIKFQAFVNLGQESWDYHIRRFLESEEEGGNSTNRIKDIDLSDLLTYCGLDSLMEYKVAKIQGKQVMDEPAEAMTASGKMGAAGTRGISDPTGLSTEWHRLNGE